MEAPPMIDDRVYLLLLERCLRLEAELAIARGMPIAPPLPPIERRSLCEAQMAPDLQLPRRIGRVARLDEITRMRGLRRRGIGVRQIVEQTGFSEMTVRRYTNDVLIEREA